MIYGSVCSGIEAATVAWHPLGWQPAFFSEIEPFCCAVLKHHYPEVTNLGDFTKIGCDGRAVRGLRDEVERERFRIQRIVVRGDGQTNEKNLDAEIPAIDLLVGGTPCQSFSVAGKRAGLDDPRGNLTLEFLALAGRLRPCWLVWENVPGVLSDDGGRTFGTVLGILGQLGYGFAYRILDAQFFGVPQRRRRVFVVGYFGDWRPPAAVLFERSSLSGNPAPGGKAGKSIAGLLGGSSRSCGFRTTDLDNSGAFITGAMSSKWAKGSGGPAGDEAYNLVTHSLRADGFDASEDGTGRGTPLVAVPISEAGKRQGLRNDTRDGLGIGESGDPMFTLQSGAQHAVAFDYKQSGNLDPTMRATNHDRSHANGGGNLAVAFKENMRGEVTFNRTNTINLTRGGGKPGQGYPAIAFTERTRANGRNLEVQDGIAYALTNPGSGGRTHSRQIMADMAVRRLTPRECERLQGFPDDYTLISYRGKPAADGPRYRALGNSMAVPVMAWIGQRIQMVEGLE